jgi:hypothetical protein
MGSDARGPGIRGSGVQSLSVSTRRVPVRSSALLVAAGLCAVAATSSNAHACLEIFGQEVSESDRRPSLAYEQTLIVYDAEKRREHFVREVVFSASREPFGFVVPTPSRTWSGGRQGPGGAPAPRNLARLDARLRAGRFASERQGRRGAAVPGRIPLRRGERAFDPRLHR